MQGAAEFGSARLSHERSRKHAPHRRSLQAKGAVRHAVRRDVAVSSRMEGDSRAVTAALHGCRSEVGVARAPPRARCSSPSGRLRIRADALARRADRQSPGRLSSWLCDGRRRRKRRPREARAAGRRPSPAPRGPPPAVLRLARPRFPNDFGFARRSPRRDHPGRRLREPGLGPRHGRQHRDARQPGEQAAPADRRGPRGSGLVRQVRALSEGRRPSGRRPSRPRADRRSPLRSRSRAGRRTPRSGRTGTHRRGRSSGSPRTRCAGRPVRCHGA